MDVYILIDNKPQGPYTRELVQRYLKSGQLKLTDLAAYAGSSDWQPLSVMMRSWGGSRRPTLRSANSIAGIVTVLVLALVVGVLAVRLMRQLPPAVRNDSPKVETNTAAQVEDDGYPKTLAELNKWYVEPPEGQNAATYFLQGADAIQIADEDSLGQGLPLFGQAGFPTNGVLSLIQRKDITRFVQKNEAAWKLIQEGARFEQARYSIDLKDANLVMSHLSKVKKAEQLAALWTVLSAANEQPRSAVDAFLVSLAVAQSLKDEPIPVSQSVRQHCTSIQRGSLKFVFNSVAVSSNDLARLAGALAQIEAQDSEGVPFTRALVGKRVLTPSYFQSPEKLKESIQVLQESKQQGWTNHTQNEMMRKLPAQCAFMMETVAQEVALRKEPFPGRLKIEEYERARAAQAGDKGFYLAQAMLSSENLYLWCGVHSEPTGLANVRVMQTAVALERFRRANHKYPDSLSELVPMFLPQVPADPFNGEPLFYLAGTGYELRCEGAKGTPIEFRVETPPKL